MSINLKKWQELLNLTIELKNLKPWDYLSSLDIVCILLPNKEEPSFISILGQNKDTYGIVVYDGYKAFESYFDILNLPELGISYKYIICEQDCLTCYFGEYIEVPDEQKEIIANLNLRFKEMCPYFLSFKPGFIPYILNDEEVDTLINVYRELIPLIKGIISQEIKVNFSINETVIRYYDEKSKKWLHEVSELNISDKMYLSLNVDINNPFISNLRTLPRNDENIEIDMQYINQAIKGSIRPIRPKLLIVTEQNQGIVRNQQLITPEVEEIEVITNLLFDYFEQFGLPKAIYYRLPIIGCLIEELCEFINVPLIQSKSLPISEDVFNDVLNFEL